MRSALATEQMTQPFVVVAVFDAATNTPIFALTNYGLGTLDADTVNYANTILPIKAQIEGVSVDETRASSLGSGITKRQVNFDIKNGGPFTDAPMSKWLYAAGATIDDFYFAVWCTDYSKSVEDITSTGTFFGYYKIDAGLGWSETDQSTTITLTDMLSMMTGRYNDNTSDAEQLLEGSEWQALLEAPAYFGYRPAIKAVGRTAATVSGFETTKDAVIGVVAGKVQSSILSGTSLVLGKSPTLATLVGDSVKLKMGNGCLIVGTITDLGSGVYGINTTGMTLNASWDSILVYSKGYTVAGDALGLANTNLQSVFLDNSQALTKIPSTSMYMKSPGALTFYGGGLQTSAGSIFAKLTGVADEANKELTCEEIKDPDNPTWLFTGINVLFHSTQQSSNFTDPDLLHLTYATWLVPQTWNLYFSDKTFVLADIQREGMTWELIVTPTVNTGVVFENVYYCRLIGDTKILDTDTGQLAIYGNNGKSLLPISSSVIESVEYQVSDFQLEDLCRIKLKARLADIDESLDPNFLQVDCGSPAWAGECIDLILTKGGIPSFTRAPNTRAGTNRLGNSLSLEIRDETWTQLLDSVLFESGLQLDAVNGIYFLRTNFTKVLAHTWNNVAASETYVRIQTEGAISFNDVIDGTYKFDIGRMLTSVDADGREFVRAHTTYTYPTASISGDAKRKLQSIRVAKSNDRVITYDFKHICDTVTALAAATQMTQMGHTANIPDTTRVVEIGLPLSYMKYQVLDTIRLDAFRHITAQDDPLVEYDNDSVDNPVYTYGTYGPYARYDADTQFMLIPGIGIVDKIRINLDGNGPPVLLTFRQVQYGMESNLYDVGINTRLNDEADNTTASATSDTTGSPNYPGGMLGCPPGVAGTSHVKLKPGTKVLGVTTQDACCDVSSTEDDTTVDTEIVVICDPPGLDDWPNLCFESLNIWYEPVTDHEVGSTDTLLFKFYTTLDNYPALISINYPGKQDPDTNVIWVPQSGVPWNAWFGTLHVAPGVFNLPVGLKFKGIELVFRVTYCTNELDPLPRNSGYKSNGMGGMIPDGNIPGSVNWNSPKGIGSSWSKVDKTVDYHVTVPVSLRDVSDIDVS